MDVVNLADMEALAYERLPRDVWDWLAGGAEDERTVAWNTEAFRRIRLRPRVLVDVRRRELAVNILGQDVALPVLVAPTSHHALVHPDAELAVARAAAAIGTIAVFGTGAHHSIEEVAAASNGTLWFQLYCYDSRPVVERIIRRAEAAGCRALVVTVDGGHYDSRRERNMRNRFRLPASLRLGNLVGVGMDDEVLRTEGAPGFLAQARSMPPTWDDIAWMRSVTHLPLILKGIMTGEDAALAVELGVDGVIVSNHGGRGVDCTLASIEALPEVVEAVAGRATVLLDSGVRRGTDVLKALALGAQAVLIGRPVLWGLAVDGEAGVRRVFEILRDEIDTALAQLGRPGVASVDRSMIVLP